MVNMIATRLPFQIFHLSWNKKIYTVEQDEADNEFCVIDKETEAQNGQVTCPM